MRVGLIVCAMLVVTRSAASEPRSDRSATRGVKPMCERIVARDIAYADLYVVGLVRHGHVEHVLLIGPSNVAVIAGAGDCVGRERVPFERVHDRVPRSRVELEIASSRPL